MARIPTVTSQGDARSGRISGSLGGRSASAAAFGGQQAQALGAAAGALDDAAAGVFQYQERKRQEDVANLSQNRTRATRNSRAMSPRSLARTG